MPSASSTAIAIGERSASSVPPARPRMIRITSWPSSFPEQIVQAGYMVITGGADGIMRASQEGAGRENSFGVNIMLPFEQGPNTTIADDPKLVTFKYFFTRKLMFQKEANAIALFPGGFGTQMKALKF